MYLQFTVKCLFVLYVILFSGDNGVKETEQREEKLQQLSSLVGALSFPPSRYSRKKHYNIGLVPSI